MVSKTMSRYMRPRIVSNLRRMEPLQLVPWVTTRPLLSNGEVTSGTLDFLFLGPFTKIKNRFNLVIFDKWNMLYFIFENDTRAWGPGIERKENSWGAPNGTA